MRRLRRATRKLEKAKERARKPIVLKESFGKFGALMESPRGIKYFALNVPAVGPFPGDFDFTKPRRVDIRNMRLPELRQATIQATEEAEKGTLSPGDLEIVLDYLFAELNTRLNKRKVQE